MSVLIEKLDRGYILTTMPPGALTVKKAFLTIDEVLVELLADLEGLSPYLGGKFFGGVRVIRSDSGEGKL